MVRMSIDKYRLWFKRSKYSSQDLRNADIRHLPLQIVSVKVKSKRFRDYCKELAFNSFLSIRPIIAYSRYSIDKDIYMLCFDPFSK